jgi:hypothetical protein
LECGEMFHGISPRRSWSLELNFDRPTKRTS